MTTSIQQNSTCCSSNLELKVMLNVQLESDWSKVKIIITCLAAWLCVLFLMWRNRDDAIML